jgi:MFS family permease
MVRVTDSLLPQIAADLGVTVGATSIVVTVYLLAHGSVQLVIGPIADRVGKYRCIALAAAGSTVMVAICGLAPSLPVLIAARLGSGLATGWIIPLALAFVGVCSAIVQGLLIGPIVNRIGARRAPKIDTTPSIVTGILAKILKR